MVVELVAGRLVAPHFGQSAATWAALTAVTLTGCMAGNALGGWLSERVRPWRVAAVALGVGGMALAALPFLLDAWAGFCRGNLILFTVGAWLPPTVALGCVTPSVAAATVDSRRTGGDLGLLYLGSMLGSMAGSLSGGLYLPFAFPADALYVAFGALLLATGLLAARFGRGSSVSAAPTDAAFSAGATGGDRIWYLPVFALGAIGMILEFSAVRLVTPVLGGSHIVWSLMFVTFIGGMGVGGAVGGRLADRVVAPALLKVMVPLTMLVVFATVRLQTGTVPDLTLGLDTASQLFVQIVLGFSPLAFLLGALTTVLLRAATADAVACGRRGVIGVLYAVNGAGSVCGTFLAGFVLIGRVPSTAVFDFFSGVGILSPSRPALPVEIREGDASRITFREESMYNVVTVTESVANPSEHVIWLDRTPHTSVDRRSPEKLHSTYTRLLQAAMDVLSEGRCRPDVFMIGGGGYQLPYYWQAVRSVGRSVVAEIDPSVKKAAFSQMVCLKEGPEALYPTDDGRRVLKADGGTYDFIIGDTINDTAIPYHLVTREFNELVKRHLREGGAYLLHALDTPRDGLLLPSLLKTLKASFACVRAVAYEGVDDVRISHVVVASDREVDVAKVAALVARRHKDAFPTVWDDAKVDAAAAREGALVLTDSFSPVERFVWRVMSRDVQYVPWKLAQKAKALYDTDRRGAIRLAHEALALQHEQQTALQVVADGVRDGVDAEENLALLVAESRRKSLNVDSRGVLMQLYRDLGREREAAEIWAEMCRRWPERFAKR